MKREKAFDWKLDGAGLAAFGAGAFLSVLAVLALTRATPVTDPLAAGGTTTLAALWTSTLGALPCLLFAAILTVLGARTFLLGEARGTLKGVAVGAGVAFGFAIVLGSLGLAAAWADGGIAGEALGGTLARRAHPAAGVLLGIVVLAAVAWFATLRERVLAREAREAVAPPVRELTQRAPKASKAPKAATSPMAAAESAEGVTAEEAAALVPDEGHRREALAAALALARGHGEAAEEYVEPPPLYPEDVRLKGQIPDGARPLGEPQRSYAAPEPVQSSGVVRWTPDRRDDADVFADEASTTAVAEPEEDLEPAVERSFVLPTPPPPVDEDEAEDAEPEDAEPEVAELEDEDEGDEAELAVATAGDDALDEAAQASSQAAPPRPSWEQNNLFQEEDEPVDAYGTPVSLVETLVEGEVEEAAELEEGEDEDEEDGYEEDDEQEEAAELEEGEDEDEEDEYEDDEEQEEAAELEEGEDEDEEDEYEEDDEQEEAAELEEGEDEDEEDEYEEDDEEQEEAAELDEEPPAAEDDPSVLIPQPTPASEHAKRAAVLDASKQRLYEAGCLFLDRGRVAVSMLQREYALEFDDACTMLDELQELGLIGPYLGGKHRDILLTSDEWLERVSAS